MKGIFQEIIDLMPAAGGASSAIAAAHQVGKRLPPELKKKLGDSLLGAKAKGPVSSIEIGKSWNLAQYIGAVAAGIITPHLAGKMMTPSQKAQFRSGALGIVLLKFLYTEVIARSPRAQSAFGGYTGRTRVDGNRQRYAELSNGAWVAMQGVPVRASQLDGVPVRASQLDGVPVRASQLDGYSVRKRAIAPRQMKKRQVPAYV